MTTDTEPRIELPPSVLAYIQALATAARLNAGEGLTGVLMLIYGWARYERQESIDPTGLALLRYRWLETCEQLAYGVRDDAVVGVNLDVAFMNSGPSCYDT